MEQLIRIIKGTDREINVVLKNAGDQSPFDLTDATVKAIFPGSDGLVTIEMGEGGGVTVRGDAARGEITITLSDTATSELQEGSRLTWEIEVEREEKTFVTQFVEGLDVVKRLSAG